MPICEFGFARSLSHAEGQRKRVDPFGLSRDIAGSNRSSKVSQFLCEKLSKILRTIRLVMDPVSCEESRALRRLFRRKPRVKQVQALAPRGERSGPPEITHLQVHFVEVGGGKDRLTGRTMKIARCPILPGMKEYVSFETPGTEAERACKLSIIEDDRITHVGRNCIRRIGELDWRLLRRR